MYKKSVFLFRRDLRLEDNTGLANALAMSEEVIACFIFNPKQLDVSNPYRGEKLLSFMAKSLQELDLALQEKGSKLYVFYDDPKLIIKRLVQDCAVEALFFNTDYTPFSKERDASFASVITNIHQFHDALLHPPQMTLKADGSPYTVFTPFWKNARLIPVPKPKPLKDLSTSGVFSTQVIDFVDTKILSSLLALSSDALRLHGGRSEALALLADVHTKSSYVHDRDFPAIDGTTKLSAHHKFGTISCRESFYSFTTAFGLDNPLVRQLYWRDFFTQIAFFSPKVFGHAFQDKYDAVVWDDNDALFQAWCEGKTGFPLVDAGMRELVTTGYMHNRARMVTASFLTKDLHIDWRKGEQFFAKHLLDYDPCVNNGSWQWAASTGTDAQPYFRVFNPWLQQKRFDPDCLYIKKWLPELANVPCATIHNLEKETVANYPRPIVDHAKEKDSAIARFKTIGM